MSKTLEIPISLLRTMAINFNLDPKHINQPKIKADLSKYKSGYRGETSINYFLYNIVNKNYKIFHNARLSTRGQNFEIDVMLLTDRFILIIEVKNLAGSIWLDHDFGIMVQKNKDREIVYQDPVNQVERQKKLLSIWLKERGIQIPIETLVSFVNKNVILERNQTKVDSRIISGYRLAPKYEEMVENYQNHKPSIMKNTLLEILTDESKPLDISLLEKYGLKQGDFIPGVICPQCLKKTMKRNRHLWKCLECGFEDTEAYIRALKDYFLIFGPKINNEQARDWLVENDSNYIKKILNRIAVRKQGSGRNLIYVLDFDYQTDYDYLVDALQKQI